jgi:sugar lactone lactonase YvrE
MLIRRNDNKRVSRYLIITFLLLLAGSLGLIYAVYSNAIITTVTGTGTSGFSGDGGLAIDAQLDSPTGVAFDQVGNLYIADRFNHRIRKVIAATGVITTVAGSGFSGPNNGGFSGDGGLATDAQLDSPARVIVDEMGNLYIADSYNDRIRKVIAATGVITTVAGTEIAGYGGDNGLATSAQLDGPLGVAIDKIGNLYIADANNNRIRQVIAATGIITTVAGSGPTGHGNGGFSGDGGPASEAQLNYPTHVAMDGAGNLYIADSENHRIRQVIAATGIITTVAGSGSTENGNGGFSGDGGPATDAQLNYPSGVAVDGQGNLFIADNSNHRIRKVIAATGVITTVAGSGIAGYSGDNGPAFDAQLNMPSDVAFDGVGNLYIVDQDNHCIRRVEGSGIFLKIYLPIILKNQ